jgi:hypothetical protein
MHMPGELLIVVVGTVIGLGFAAFKISHISWKFVADLISGRLKRDQNGNIEDAAARENIKKIKEAGWIALFGIIGGPLLLTIPIATPFTLLGLAAFGVISIMLKKK